MFYLVNYNDGSFELQNCDGMARLPNGDYQSQSYGGGGVWGGGKTFAAAEVRSVVDFPGPVAAERELISMGGTWSGDRQGPFPPLQSGPDTGGGDTGTDPSA